MRSRKLTERRRQAEIVRCRLLVLMAERRLTLKDVARDTGYSFWSIVAFTEDRLPSLSWPLAQKIVRTYFLEKL